MKIEHTSFLMHHFIELEQRLQDRIRLGYQTQDIEVEI